MADKAKITKIGIVEDGVAKNWDFDCEGKNIPAIDMATGKIAGYTIEELKEIAMADTNDELREAIRQILIDPDRLEFGETQVNLRVGGTTDRIMTVVLADREKAVKEARVDEGSYYIEEFSALSGDDMKYLEAIDNIKDRIKALESGTADTKEESKL